MTQKGRQGKPAVEPGCGKPSTQIEGALAGRVYVGSAWRSTVGTHPTQQEGRVCCTIRCLQLVCEDDDRHTTSLGLEGQRFRLQCRAAPRGLSVLQTREASSPATAGGRQQFGLCNTLLALLPNPLTGCLPVQFPLSTHRKQAPLKFKNGLAMLYWHDRVAYLRQHDLPKGHSRSKRGCGVTMERWRRCGKRAVRSARIKEAMGWIGGRRARSRLRAWSELKRKGGDSICTGRWCASHFGAGGEFGQMIHLSHQRCSCGAAVTGH